MKNVVLLLVVVLAGFIGLTDIYAKGKRSSGGYKSYKEGKAIDGDTFLYKGQRYRIQQYNTPELGQPGSRKATRDLQRKLDSGKYKWSPVTKDVYGRTIVKEKEK
jgi:endonuclease YncB( thermonuclease family)